jgi:hypothetical protein
MNSLANALGKDFVKKKEAVRIRTFELGGHTFKVKIPLTVEFEIMQQRMKTVDEEKVEKYYKDITKELQKDNNVEGVVITDDDIVIQGRSMKEASKNKAIAEQRITEFFKLLVPEDDKFDMNTITYAMIEELFPFPIQMQVMEEISRVVSIQYEVQKGK